MQNQDSLTIKSYKDWQPNVTINNVNGTNWCPIFSLNLVTSEYYGTISYGYNNNTKIIARIVTLPLKVSGKKHCNNNSHG